MSQTYTREIFYRFQHEMEKLMSYNCKHIMGDIYETICITDFVPDYGDRTYTVHANVGAEHYECQCSKMERDGMVCCHILKVREKCLCNCHPTKTKLPYYLHQLANLHNVSCQIFRPPSFQNVFYRGVATF